MQLDITVIKLYQYTISRKSSNVTPTIQPTLYEIGQRIQVAPTVTLSIDVRQLAALSAVVQAACPGRGTLSPLYQALNPNGSGRRVRKPHDSGDDCDPTTDARPDQGLRVRVCLFAVCDVSDVCDNERER